MAYEQKDMSGSMFDNDRKTTDNHPDFKGSCMVAGVEYWVSGWSKAPEGKRAYTSLAFTKKEPRAEGQADAPRAPTAPVEAPKAIPEGASRGTQAIMDMKDDIPF